MSSTGLPSDWSVRYSRTKKREYYLHNATKQSQWNAPDGTDTEQLHKYLAEHPVSVRCQHLLIKHRDSRRPASHRSEHISISKEEAIDELQQYRDQLQQDSSRFAELAEKRSDCSSFKRGGDLGRFGRGEMQPSFEQAAFKLAVGEMSDVVESDSGVHLIKRVA